MGVAYRPAPSPPSFLQAAAYSWQAADLEIDQHLRPNPSPTLYMAVCPETGCRRSTHNLCSGQRLAGAATRNSTCSCQGMRCSGGRRSGRASVCHRHFRSVRPRPDDVSLELLLGPKTSQLVHFMRGGAERPWLRRGRPMCVDCSTMTRSSAGGPGRRRNFNMKFLSKVSRSPAHIHALARHFCAPGRSPPFNTRSGGRPKEHGKRDAAQADKAPAEARDDVAHVAWGHSHCLVWMHTSVKQRESPRARTAPVPNLLG